MKFSVNIPPEVQFVRAPKKFKEKFLPRLESGGTQAGHVHFANGLATLYCFNQQMAANHFCLAYKADPSMRCALGFAAYALSLNVNHSVIDRPVMAFALNLLQLALEQPASAGEAFWTSSFLSAIKGRMLTPETNALAPCNVKPEGTDLKKKLSKWLRAMRRMHDTHPDEEDISVLYAASLMQQTPWKWWPQGSMYDAHMESSASKVSKNTMLVLELLNDVLRANPNHIGALHYFLHAVEESPFPEIAYGAATRIERIFKDQGHIAHMPSHIYSRCGYYAHSIRCNARAIRDDLQFQRAIKRELGVVSTSYYTREYMAHNLDFLLTDACRLFDAKSVRKYGPMLTRHVVRFLALDAKGNGFMQHFLSRELECSVLFGNFKEVLRAPVPSRHFMVFYMQACICKCIAACRLKRKKKADYFLKLALSADDDIVQRGHTHKHSHRSGGITNPHTGPAKESAETTTGTKTVNNATQLSLLRRQLLLGEHKLAFGKKSHGLACMKRSWFAYMKLFYDEPTSFFMPIGCRYAQALYNCGKYDQMDVPLKCEEQAYPNRPRVLLLRLLQAKKIKKHRVRVCKLRIDAVLTYKDSLK